MNTDDYNEADELKSYVSFNFRQLTTKEEGEELDKRFRLFFDAVAHLKHRDPNLMSKTDVQFIEQQRGPFDSLEAEISQRVWSEINSGAIRINRCPECSRIVRTPRAKQCLWCGHDWH